MPIGSIVPMIRNAGAYGLFTVQKWIGGYTNGRAFCLHDYLNANTNNVYTLKVGGNYNNDTNAGVGYANSNNNFTNSNNNYGARFACMSMTEIYRVFHLSNSLKQQNAQQNRLVASKKMSNGGVQVTGVSS